MGYKYTNKKIFFNKYIFIIVSFAIPSFVFANISITEIMYDLDGADIDWVEIYNPDATDIDLTTLKLLISNSTSNHGISSYSGSTTLPSGGYGVIVSNSVIDNFISKWGNSGNTFTASFTLPNSEGKVDINNGDKTSPIDSVSYSDSMGAAGDGNSLQKINGVWTATSPTPGISAPTGSSGGASAPTSGSSQLSNSTTEQSSGSSATVQTIWADAGSDRTAIVGAGTIFEGKAFGTDKKPLDGARYFWNFGDGLTGEGRKVMHTYKTPGDYIVYLDVSNGSLSAGDKILVKAAPADVSISALGYGEKSFVAVSNGETAELDISYWQIKSSSGVFVVPKNTIIIPGNKIIFSKDALGFEISESDEIFLIYPNGSLAYRFSNAPLSFATVNQAAGSNTNEKLTVILNSYNDNEPDEEGGVKGDEASLNKELAASVADSLSDNGSFGGMYKWLLGAFAVMAISIFGTMVIKKIGPVDKDDQEIKILE